MQIRSFSRLTVAFAVGVAAGACFSVISIIAVSRQSFMWPTPTQTASSRRFISVSNNRLNSSVNRPMISKTAGQEQTKFVTKPRGSLPSSTDGLGRRLPYHPSAFNQLSNRQAYIGNKTTNVFQTTAATRNESAREKIPRHEFQNSSSHDDTEAAVYRKLTGVTSQIPVSLSQNRSVATTTTSDKAATGFRVPAASAHVFPLSLARRRALLAHKFKPLMTTEERGMLVRSLKVLASLLQEAGVTYFLFEGTLLGSFRHRGFIPWDDDMDIIANYSQEATLRRALQHVPGYTLDLWDTWRYKFYAKDALPIPGKGWLWPFIDIFFFNETDGRIFDSGTSSNGVYSYSKSDVFPLLNRPFDGLWLPVPHKEEAVLRQSFDFTSCMSNVYSHKYEKYVPESERYSVACKYLYAIYPFVFRNASKLPVHEIVKVGDKVIAEYTYS